MLYADAPILDVLGSLIPWLLVGAICGVILFKDSIAAYRARGDDPGRFPRAETNDWDRWIVALAGPVVYVVVLGLPLVWAVDLVCVISAAKREGLTPQDIALAREIVRNQNWFQHLPPLLEAAATQDDMASPAWVRLKAYVVQQLGGPRRFGKDVWQSLVDWGREVGGRAGARPEDLSEPVAVRLALRRLLGQDDLPDRVDRFRARVQGTLRADGLPGGDSLDGVARQFFEHAILCHVFYPNDDMAYLAFSQGIYRHPSDVVPVWMLAPILIMALLVQRGMRVVTVRGLGRVLGVRRDRAYLAFERESFNPWYFLAGFAVVGTVSIALAWAFMEPYYVLVYRNGPSYSLAAIWNVLMGGVLAESLGNVAAVVLIRFGCNPMRTVLDNIAVAAASAAVLWYLQNSWFSIVTALALGVLQSLLLKGVGRRHSAGASAAGRAVTHTPAARR